MKRTWLVQRLNKPIKKTGGLLDNAHRVFGGGMMQMKEELWDLLDPLFTVDYMGSAEYEFGALPRALGELFDDKDKLVRFQFVIKAKDIAPNWSRESMYRKQRRKEIEEAKAKGEKPKRAKKPKAVEDRTVYVLCRDEHKEYAVNIIHEMAKDELRTKDSNKFSTALDPIDDRDRETIGWLELDNGFLFFVDETAWRSTCELFGLEEAA